MPVVLTSQRSLIQSYDESSFGLLVAIHSGSVESLSVALAAAIAVCSASTTSGKGDATSIAVLRLTILNICPGCSADGKYSVAPGSAPYARRTWTQRSVPLDAASMIGSSCPGSRK